MFKLWGVGGNSYSIPPLRTSLNMHTGVICIAAFIPYEDANGVRAW